MGKETVVAAVREVLKSIPPGEVTFKDIASIAKIDQRLIRYYFGSLPNLLNVVAIEVTEELRERFVIANAREGSVKDRLRARVAVFLDFFGQNPHYHRLVVEFVVKASGSERDAALRRFRYSMADLQALLQSAGHAELSVVDAQLLHIAMAATCEFLFSAKPIFVALFGTEADTPKFKERFCDFVTDLVLGVLQPR